MRQRSNEIEQKRTIGMVILWSMFACIIVSPAWAGNAPKKIAANVIVMIADGCSSEQYAFARWFKGESLSFDPYGTGAVKTHIADSIVADSAQAASAFATGYRTSDKFISVGPHEKTITGTPEPQKELQYKPLASVLEGARLMKKATGIVVTSRVTHATPAAYMAHVPSRDMENDIMEQAVYQGIDVVFGGGRRHLLPKEAKGKRSDGENLLEVLKRNGYQIAQNRDELMNLKSGKVFGMFASSHMDAEIDRPMRHPGQPALSEMTAKAIDLLSDDPDGFFLMVEGSQIDWACHANDPAHLLGDMLAFDKAVKCALDFAINDDKTLVLVLSDHNTGGFTIGNYATSFSYAQMKTNVFLEPFRKMSASSSVLWNRVSENKTLSRMMNVVKEGWGMDITVEDADMILELAGKYRDDPHYAFGEILCPKYTYIGWTSHGHTGGDVPLFAYGPGKPSGVLDGPEIAKVCADAMGMDLDLLNKRLFVDPETHFAENVILDENRPWNPVVIIEYRGKRLELPVNKNILKMGDKEIQMEGVVIHAPNTGKIYIPMQAVHLITNINASLPDIRK